MPIDSKYLLGQAIRYLSEAAKQRAAGGWIPPKERAKQEQAQQKQFIADEKERQKNLEKFNPIKDKSGAPMVFYHGTNKPDFSQFKLPGKKGTGGNAIFVSSDPKTAEYFTHKAQGSRIYPVYIRANNIFDHQDEEHANALADFVYANHEKLFPGALYGPETSAAWAKSGDYGILEHPEVKKWMKKQGHDGFYVRERQRGALNIGIFDPSQIKSATGNNGNFDPTSPRINEARGGPILSKQFPTHYMPEVGRQVMADGGKTTEERQQDATDMGFNPTVLYHAGHSDFPQFELQDWAKTTGEKAHFFTTDPKVADSYLGGQYIRADAPDAIKHGVAPMENNVGRIYAQGAQVYPVRIRDVNENTFHVYDMGGGSYNPSFMKQALNDAKKDKKKGIVLMGVKDPGMFQSGPLGSAMGKSNLVAVFDKYANHIRSVNAQFNPKNKNNRDLLKSDGGSIDRDDFASGGKTKKHPALSIAGTHIREEEHGEPIFTGRL